MSYPIRSDFIYKSEFFFLLSFIFIFRSIEKIHRHTHHIQYFIIIDAITRCKMAMHEFAFLEPDAHQLKYMRT